MRFELIVLGVLLLIEFIFGFFNKHSLWLTISFWVVLAYYLLGVVKRSFDKVMREKGDKNG